MTERRFVIDTNVYISAAISPRGKPNRVVEKVIQNGVVLASAATFHELETRLTRRRFDKYVSIEKQLAYFDFIKDESLFIEPTTTIRACSDPDDDQFLDLAVSGQADYLITGNIKDFPPSPFRGIEILTPAAFLVRISESQ